MSGGISVAVVGLGFGRSWVPVYQAHPGVSEVILCDADPSVLADVADERGIERRYASLDDVLAADDIDAVHLLTPLDLHAAQAAAALRAGKHCAVAVTAGLAMDELRELVRLQRSTGRNYMMMETAAYSAPAIHLKRMVDDGSFGEVSFGRGAHLQDMEGWPGYWTGLPPMWYSTHALGSLLHILGTRATTVRALGSGRLPADKQARWGNPFPVETALFELADSPVVVEITRSLFKTVSSQVESFSLYSDRHGFDWSRDYQLGDHLFHSQGELGLGGRGYGTVTEPFRAGDTTSTLPPAFREVAESWGSLAHLVHEFVDSAIAGRTPSIDAVVAGNWTAAGLAAHESALAGGTIVEIPDLEAEA